MSDYLQWTEKHRPNCINDIVGHQKNIMVLRKILENKSLPHLLFYGPPGTGKTTTILALIHDIYKNDAKLMVMKLDASDDRGINSVREEIKGFADKSNMFVEGIQVIILDEIDSMTYDAQFALRKIIEKYSETIRFCLICNYDNKIIPAIKSRCMNFRFNYVNNLSIVKKLNEILQKEKVVIDSKIIETITYISKGDLRKAINILQTMVIYNKNLTPEICYKLYNTPTSSNVDIILSYLINDKLSFSDVYYKLYNIFTINNYTMENILRELLLKIINNDKLLNISCDIIINLSSFELFILKSSNLNIYLSILISIFREKIEY